MDTDLINLLASKVSDASLKRIMKITFFLGLFYMGVPFMTYIMFKNRNATDISFAHQLTLTSYSYVIFIPASILIAAFQSYYRFKYLVLLIVWAIHLYYLYKNMYDVRKKYFDFESNKQMAWIIVGSSFFFMWIYKSFFL